jgi:hypothetical protein
MKRFALCSLFAGLLLAAIFAPIGFAQTQTSSQAPVQDPQAVAILTQVLTAAGGQPRLSTIQDFTASGNITYDQPRNVGGNVTVRGTNLEQFRLDATLPTGIRSQAITDGQITLKTEDGTVSHLHFQAPLGPERTILPCLFLSPVLNSGGFSLSYKGIAQIDGGSVHEIEVQEVMPALVDPSGAFREYHTIDFFIDTSTFRVLMMQDTVPQHLLRQIRFSDYRNVGGILVPFSISEQSGGLPTWTIQLNQISFNSGLQDSDFQL